MSTQKLAQRAQDLSRQIYASLPWGYRIAQLLSKLALDTQEVLGRFIYAEFIKAGVEGLPDIQGQPALSYQDKVRGPNGVYKLPKDYGRSFGQKAWFIAFSKLRNQNVVEEAVATAMMRLVKRNPFHEGTPLKTAESYVITAILNLGRNIIRNTARRREDSLSGRQRDDGSENPIDLKDPDSFEGLDDLIPSSDLPGILRNLERVHEKAPAWVQFQMEGFRSREIAEQWGISAVRMSQWQKKYLPHIKRIFDNYFRSAA